MGYSGGSLWLGCFFVFLAGLMRASASYCFFAFLIASVLWRSFWFFFIAFSFFEVIF